jgi:hypothetical protein
VLLVTGLCLGDAEQDLALVARAASGQIAVDGGLGPLVGEVAPPAANLRPRALCHAASLIAGRAASFEPVKLAVALALALALCGCTETPAPVPPVFSPPPSAAAAPQLGEGVLFVITATTTSARGERVQLSMTGYQSQPFDAVPELAQSFVDQCRALGGGVVLERGGGLDDETLAAVGSSLMLIETVSTPANEGLGGGIELLLGNPFYTVVASGDGLSNPYAHECFGGYQIDSTGTVASITNYETGSPAPDLAQWRSGRYGFSVAFGSTQTLADCVITLSQLAIDSGVGDIDGWYPEGGTDQECAIGYRGQ